MQENATIPICQSKILIVDDDPNNQRILKYTLCKAGYEVSIASNGESALARLDESEVALAIFDLAMPVMDGIALLKLVRANHKYEHLPVIILTGSGDDSDRNRAEQEGIQAFLTKPASSRTIVETVKTALSHNVQH